MGESICAAITERRLLKFYYVDDEPGCYRVIEPYTLGWNTADQLILDGWFDAGASASNEAPGFRDYLIKKMTSLAVLEKHFIGPQPGYVLWGARNFAVFYAIFQCPKGLDVP